MSKIAVKFVKYDMDKTKNRKRKNLLVSGHTEIDVINQLEKIHKGEKVIKIYEIIWDDDKNSVVSNRKVLMGEVKFFDHDKGFGFIAPDDESVEDLFFHESAIESGEINDFDLVEFEVSKGPKGLCAIHIKLAPEA